MPQCRQGYKTYIGPNKYDMQPWMNNQMIAAMTADPLFNKSVIIYDQVCGNEKVKGIAFGVAEQYPDASGTLRNKVVQIYPSTNKIHVSNGRLMRADGQKIDDYGSFLGLTSTEKSFAGDDYTVINQPLADTIRKSFEKVEHLKMGEINLAMSDLSAADAREINGVIEYVVGQLTPPALKSAKPKGKSLQNNPQKPLR